MSDYSYDAQTAAPVLREKAAFHAEHGGAVGARIDVVRKRLSVLGFKQTKTFAPTPAIDPDFAARVREKMDDLHDMDHVRHESAGVGQCGFSQRSPCHERAPANGGFGQGGGGRGA